MPQRFSLMCVLLAALLGTASSCQQEPEDAALAHARDRIERSLAGARERTEGALHDYLVARYEQALRGIETWPREAYPQPVLATLGPAASGPAEGDGAGEPARWSLFVVWLDLAQTGRGFVLHTAGGTTVEIEQPWAWGEDAAATFGQGAWRHVMIPVARDAEEAAAWQRFEADAEPVRLDAIAEVVRTSDGRSLRLTIQGADGAAGNTWDEGVPVAVAGGASR